MLKGAKEIFKDDSLGRLKFICWLHDFENIQIACDLTDDSPLEWGSEFMEEAGLDNLNKDLGEDPVFQGHLKHMESAGEFSSKCKAKK